MKKIFTEFENENALRTYPFAAGCSARDTEGAPIGTGILVDAVLYPVNHSGNLYLSKIGKDGVVSISDSDGEVMTAVVDKNSTELSFYDTTGMHRHVGTLIASSENAIDTLVNVYEDREFLPSETTFASSCVFPISNDGVLSINVGGIGALDGVVEFENGKDDTVRVSTDQSCGKLRFDVVPVPKKVNLESIQHIYCIVDGKTPFRIIKIPFAGEPSGDGNTVAVYLDNITRQDVCSDRNRDDSLEMRDTCSCGEGDECGGSVPPVALEETYQAEVVDVENGADGAFYLTVPNMTGYDNPLSVTLVDGATEPITEIDVGIDSDNVKSIKNKVKSNGIVIQVPGLGQT